MPVDITYDNLDPVLSTPDYSFLRYVLGKKTSRYEQGLKAVSDSYNSLKKDLTDPTNIEKRDQYLQDAEAELQKVASSDLSILQNVAAAEAIFDPLARDKAFVVDSYYTEKNKRELAKMREWAESDDPNERKKFNPEIEAWLKRDLNSIRNGKGDVNNYKVEGRSAWAFVDPQDILKTAVKDYGYKVKLDAKGQPYIVTTEGGPTSIRNAKIFAENVLGADPLYKEQTRILSQAQLESAVEKMKKDPKYANADMASIYRGFAQETAKAQRDADKQYLDENKKSIQYEQSLLEADYNKNSEIYLKGKADYEAGVESENAQKWMSYSQKRAELNSLVDKMNDGYDNFVKTWGDGKEISSEKLVQFTDNFVKSPQGFFYNRILQNDVTRFANIEAAIEERTLKADEAYFKTLTERREMLALKGKTENEITDNANAARLTSIKEAELNLKGKKTVKKEDGTTEVVDITSDIKPLSASTTQATLERLQNLQANVKNASTAALYSMVGTNGGFDILEGMGLNPSKVSQIKGLYRKYYEAEDKKSVTITAEDKALMEEAFNTMSAFATNNSNSGFPKTLDAKSVTIDQFPDLLKKAVTGYTPKSNNEALAKRQIDEHQNEIIILNKNIEAYNKGKAIVWAAAEKDSDLKKMFSKKKDGSIGLIDEKDIASIFTNARKSQTALPLEDKSLIESFSRAYFDGSLKVSVTQPEGAAAAARTGGSTIPYTHVTYNGVEHVFIGNLFATIPTPKDYKKYLKKINEEMPVADFSKQAGLVLGSPSYAFSGEAKKTVLNDFQNVTVTNSNIFEYDEGTAKEDQVSPELQTQIRNAIAAESQKKDSDLSIVLYTSSPLNNGGQAIKVTFPPTPASQKNSNDYDGKSYYFPVNITPSTPEIFKVFDKAISTSVYDEYRQKGTGYEVNTFESSGIKYTFFPTEPGASTGKVYIHQQKYNDATKTYDEQFTKVEDPNYGDLQYDINKMTFPEIEQTVFQNFIQPYLKARIARMRDEASAAKTTPINNTLNRLKY